MDKIDNFLREIENQYQQKKVNSNPSMEHKNPSHQNDIDAFLSQIESQKKIEEKKTIEQDLLSEIETQFKQKKSQSTTSNIQEKNNDLLAEIEASFTQEKSHKQANSDIFADIEKQYQAKKNNASVSSKSNITENYITDLVTNYQQKQKAISNEKKSHNVEEIRWQELEKQRQEKLLTRQAETWLKNLDPYSDEGFWFEQFALSYSSKLEAAIEYLKALNAS